MARFLGPPAQQPQEPHDEPKLVMKEGDRFRFLEVSGPVRIEPDHVEGAERYAVIRATILAGEHRNVRCNIEIPITWDALDELGIAVSRLRR